MVESLVSCFSRLYGRLHVGVIAAFADIIELGRSKLARSRTGLAQAWMFVLGTWSEYVLTSVLKLLLLISSCIMYLKFIGASSLLCFVSKGGYQLFSGGCFPFLHFEESPSLKVHCTKFRGKINVVMLES